MREVVDGIVYDTDGAQFVTGYKERRRRGGGRGDRLESGAMYVMASADGGKKRIFLVERPATGEAFAEPIDAGTARVVVDEWLARGRIAQEAARMALGTLDMVAPASDGSREPPGCAAGGASGGGQG